MVNIWSVGKNSDKYSEALEQVFNTGKTSTCLLSNYSVTLEYLVNEDEIMSKYPEEALEYLVATDEMSIVQIFLGTCLKGSFWIQVGTCNRAFALLDTILFGHLKAEAK